MLDLLGTGELRTLDMRSPSMVLSLAICGLDPVNIIFFQKQIFAANTAT